MNKFLNFFAYNVLFLAGYSSAMEPQTMADLAGYYTKIVDQLTKQPIVSDRVRDGQKKELEVSYHDAAIAYRLETLTHPSTNFFVDQEHPKTGEVIWKLCTNNIDHKVNTENLAEEYGKVISFLQQDWFVEKDHDQYTNHYAFYKKMSYSDTFGIPHLLVTRQLLSHVAAKLDVKLSYCSDHSCSDHGLIVITATPDQSKKLEQVFNFQYISLKKFNSKHSKLIK